MRYLQVGKVVEHKSNRYRKATVGLRVGVADESREGLRYKQVGERIEATVEIADGDEERSTLASQSREIDLIRIGVQTAWSHHQDRQS